MVRHKLYCNISYDSPLSASMVRSGESVSPYISQTPKENQKKPSDGDGDGDCDGNSDSDFSTITNLTLFSEKRPYTMEEDMEILKFVLKDQNIYRVSSVLLWKYLEVKKKNPKRTYQSLKNRFLRNIKPKLFTLYGHLITSDEQIKKILAKFPELKKDAKAREPLRGLNLPPRKQKDKVDENKKVDPNLNQTSRSSTPPPIEAGTRKPVSNEPTSDAGKENNGREVKFKNNTVIVTVPAKLVTSAPSTFDNVGLYEKYLNLKSKNKLVRCLACGRFGASDFSEEQYNENEDNDSDDSDDVILNSAESESSENFKCAKNFENNKKGVVTNEKRKGVVSSEKKNVEVRGEKRNVDVISEKRTADVARAKRRKDDSAREISRKTSNSPSLLGDRSSREDKMENRSNESKDRSKGTLTQINGARNRYKEPASVSTESKGRSKNPAKQSSESEGRLKEAGSAKAASSNSSSRKYFTPLENTSGDLTDRELDSLYEETAQECQKLISSEEEEALVKKCFKKNRRSIGFDSYVQLKKIDVDSFFVKTTSPSLESLSPDPMTSAQKEEEERPLVGQKESPLVENMMRMLRSRNIKIS